MMPQAQNTITPHIECTDMQLTIAGRVLYNNLNLNLKPGEVWAVLGLNGAGKTTLLHTLAGIRPAGAGQIKINGKQIEQWTRIELARQVGLLLQTQQDPFPGKVIEHVLIGRHPHLNAMQWESEEDYKLAHQALNMVGLTGFENRSLQTLSGGEYQRMLIAMVLVQQPQCFLLDEPVNHLDWQHQHQILKTLVTMAKEQSNSILMALHDVNLAARYCSHCLMLFDDGQIAMGKTTELLDSERLEQLYHTPISTIDSPQGSIFIPG